METIIISENNRSKIEKLIATAEGRATVRTVDFSDIMQAVDEMTKRFSSISKKALEGTSVHYDYSATTYPKAYKYTPESTQIDIIFKGGKWRLTDVARMAQRTYCRSGYTGYDIKLSATAEAAILEVYSQF